MRNIEIIRPDIITGYEIVDLPENEVVIEHLKKIEPYIFKVINIDKETRDRILSQNRLKEFPGNQDDLIVDYIYDFDDEQDFRLEIGLKLSSKTIEGTFIIEDERIIYDPTKRFYEEKEYYKRSPIPLRTFYTTSSMEELLLDELQLDRECYIYCGEKLVNKTKMIPELMKVSKDELLDYSGINKNQEKQLVKKI